MIRVRFAPSPTGYLHIGGLRTAIFNWLFARHNNGKFLIRIEDTDLGRSSNEYVNSILDSLEWMKITSDENLVFQSKRYETYRNIINRLLDEGKAYRCFCSPEEIEQRCGSSVAEGGYCTYDKFCRNLNLQEQNQKPFVIRFKLPENRGKIEFNDIIRGKLVFDINQLDDFIIARSDGSPTYNFVVVVDDAFMKISHVIRGEDHISNTPKQILLYEACGFAIPYFAHIPLILDSEGGKLSKRNISVSVLEYKDQGYLSEALLNYLVRLGWSYGDQEIFSREDLIKYFTLEGVGKKGAIFDIEKLNWLNGIYIRQTGSKEILRLILKDVDSNFKERISNWSDKQILGLIELYKDRSKTLLEIISKIEALYISPQKFDDEDSWINTNSIKYIGIFLEKMEHLDIFNAKALYIMAKELCKSFDIKLAKLAQPLRIAITGKSFSPGIFELIEILGRQESKKRLQFFLKAVK